MDHAVGLAEPPLSLALLAILLPSNSFQRAWEHTILLTVRIRKHFVKAVCFASSQLMWISVFWSGVPYY
jgi:hypothetical protein